MKTYAVLVVIFLIGLAPSTYAQGTFGPGSALQPGFHVQASALSANAGSYLAGAQADQLVIVNFARADSLVILTFATPLGGLDNEREKNRLRSALKGAAIGAATGGVFYGALYLINPFGASRTGEDVPISGAIKGAFVGASLGFVVGLLM